MNYRFWFVKTDDLKYMHDYFGNHVTLRHATDDWYNRTAYHLTLSSRRAAEIFERALGWDNHNRWKSRCRDGYSIIIKHTEDIADLYKELSKIYFSYSTEILIKTHAIVIREI